MPKIKEVYEYSNGSWANGTPIGADASNVDVALSDSISTRDLQTVLGNVSVSDPSMKTQLTGKVNASGGDIKDTVVSVLDPASETDTSEDINSTDVVVAAGESQTTMWSKFNMFRKRVSNKFSNFLISSVEDVLEPSDTKTYSQAALNSYFADVIGYKTDADVATVGSVADQLSTLNNNMAWMGTASGFINNVTILVANSNVMTIGTQNIVAIRGLVRRGVQTDPEQHMMVFGSLTITTTQTRSNLPAFYLADPWNPERKLIAHSAHFILCRVNDKIQYSFCTDNPPYFSVPGTWTANSEARFLFSTVFTPYNS